MYQKVLLFAAFFALIPLHLADLNIHIIPHTHLDPGWLRTPEEYYSRDEVYNIFNTAFRSLYNDKQKRKTFVINETYYFRIWYNKLSEEDKLKFKELIKEKRIEFVLGGYVANDEATPSYHDIADQMRVGNQFLLEEFNVVPKTAWFIDSFGHSAGNAYMMSRLNYDNIVMGRMHVDYLEIIKNRKIVEFNWVPFNLNKNIFAHIMPLHYGFPVQDLKASNSYFRSSFGRIIRDLLDNLKQIYKGVHHKNLLFLYGDDFQFKNDNNFGNIDYLVDMFQNPNEKNLQSQAQRAFGINEKVNFIYSTPERYFKAAKEELKKNNIELFKYTLDFYPLKTNCFWTGYFSSRPYLKGYIRKASNVFYAMSKYYSTNKLIDGNNQNNDYNQIINKINKLREGVGLSQHHDAITGTSTRAVSRYYYNNHKNDINEMEKELKKSIENDFKIKIGNICYNNYIVDQKDCSTEFIISGSSSSIKIGLLNPNSYLHINNVLIEIEFQDSSNYYEIEGIKSDFFCINDKNMKKHENFKYRNKCFLNFFYEFKNGEQISYVNLRSKENISNKYYKLNEVINDGQIELIKDKTRIKSLIFYPSEFQFKLEYYSEQKLKKLDFTYYDGMYYVNLGRCNDGAYLFAPYNKYPEKIAIDYENSFYFIGNIGITFVTRNKGTSFTFFHIFYNPFFAKAQHFFDSLKESYFLKRFSFGHAFTIKTNINNMKEDNLPIFYTDANGLEMIQRKIDRFSLVEKIDVSSGGNFYPVTSSISIKDENEENGNIITMFNDRGQAGSALLPGSISLITQRLSYGNDQKGLPENLYEVESMENYDLRTTHFIMFGLNINNDRNDYSISNLEIKTNSLSFMFNYLNSAFIMFKITQEQNIDKEIKERNNKIKDYITKNINISPDIRCHYEIVDNRLVMGIYFRYYNSYFDFNNKINNSDSGQIKFNFSEKPKFKIYYDDKGINYNKIRGNIISDEKLKEYKIPKDQSFSLGPDEFLYIYFYLE